MRVQEWLRVGMAIVVMLALVIAGACTSSDSSDDAVTPGSLALTVQMTGDATGTVKVEVVGDTGTPLSCASSQQSCTGNFAIAADGSITIRLTATADADAQSAFSSWTLPPEWGAGLDPTANPLTVRITRSEDGGAMLVPQSSGSFPLHPRPVYGHYDNSGQDVGALVRAAFKNPGGGAAACNAQSDVTSVSPSDVTVSVGQVATFNVSVTHSGPGASGPHTFKIAASGEQPQACGSDSCSRTAGPGDAGTDVPLIIYEFNGTGDVECKFAVVMHVRAADAGPDATDAAEAGPLPTVHGVWSFITPVASGGARKSWITVYADHPARVNVAGVGSQWIMSYDVGSASASFMRYTYGTAVAGVPVPTGGTLLLGDTFGDAVNPVGPLMTLVDANGGFVWSYVYGAGSMAASAAVLSGGDIVFTYWDNAFANSDLGVVRTDRTGATVKWAKAYGGPGEELPRSVIALPGGDIVLAGETASFGAGGTDLWALRLAAADGSIVWQKAYGGAADEGDPINGGGGLQLSADGNVWFGSSTKSFGAGGQDMLFLKLSAADGSVLAQKVYGGPATDDTTSTIDVTSAQGFQISGTIYTPPAGGSASTHALLSIRTDKDFASLWAKVMGGTDRYHGIGGGVTSTGDPIVVSGTNGTVTVAAPNADGTLGATCDNATIPFSSSDPAAGYVWGTPAVTVTTTAVTPVTRTPAVRTLTAPASTSASIPPLDVCK
jgi:hypothetical protein